MPTLVLICLKLNVQSQTWRSDRITPVVQSVQNLNFWRDWNSKCRGGKKHKNSEWPLFNFCILRQKDMWTPGRSPLVCCPLLLFPWDLHSHGDVTEGQLTAQSAFQLELQTARVMSSLPEPERRHLSIHLFTFLCSHPDRERLPSSVVPIHIETNAAFKQGCPHTFGHVVHMVAAAGL